MFATQIRYFGVYMWDNLMVFMMVDNLGILLYIDSYKLMRFYQSYWSTFKV
jgi:hypothetical protein